MRKNKKPANGQVNADDFRLSTALCRDVSALKRIKIVKSSKKFSFVKFSKAVFHAVELLCNEVYLDSSEFRLISYLIVSSREISFPNNP
jgi:hypothetical protein